MCASELSRTDCWWTLRPALLTPNYDRCCQNTSPRCSGTSGKRSGNSKRPILEAWSSDGAISLAGYPCTTPPRESGMTCGLRSACPESWRRLRTTESAYGTARTANLLIVKCVSRVDFDHTLPPSFGCLQFYQLGHRS